MASSLGASSSGVASADGGAAVPVAADPGIADPGIADPGIADAPPCFDDGPLHPHAVSPKHTMNVDRQPNGFMVLHDITPGLLWSSAHS